LENLRLVGETAIWPLLVYFLAVVVTIAGMLVLITFLGQKHRERATDKPYESGIVSTGSARLRVSVKFYLLALFFVIFDVEAVFIFAWAVCFRDVGWLGYAEVCIFIGILVVALVYLWRQGALDWGTSGHKKHRVGGQELE
jgi:NADH-quinone oxidoreductase subunit A